MVMTADDFLTKVGAACLWGSSQSDWPRTGAQVLSIADDLILGEVWPQVIKLAKDYYVCTLDHELQVDYSRYRQPARTFGPLRDVLYVDSDGNEISLDLIDLDDLGHRERLRVATRFHYIDGDYIGIEPVPETGETGTLRIRYFRAPSRLVLVATATTVTAVDLESDPLAFTVDDPSVLDEGSDYDIVSAGNAHMVLAEDATADDISGSVVTVEDSLLGSGIQVGDYVSAAGTTPILQVPDHAIPWLVQLTAAESMRQQDPDGAVRAELKAGKLLAAMVAVGSPRTLSEPQSAADNASDAVWR